MHKFNHPPPAQNKITQKIDKTRRHNEYGKKIKCFQSLYVPSFYTGANYAGVVALAADEFVEELEVMDAKVDVDLVLLKNQLI